MSKYCVYVHTNKINGLKHVGITSLKPEERWRAGHGYKRQTVFWNAIVKYGWDNFTHEVIAADLSAQDAWTLEQELIAKYKSTDRSHGYNRSTGGEAGAKGVERSEKNKQSCSAALKRLWENEDFREQAIRRARTLSKSPEVRKKISESSKGRTVSEETRRKISERKMGRKLGPFSEEHKAKIKANHAGGTDKRPVFCVEQRKIYPSINDASRATGINKKGISGCCREVEHYNTAGGYHWKFA